jgi:hypothetical protein
MSACASASVGDALALIEIPACIDLSEAFAKLTVLSNASAKFNVALGKPTPECCVLKLNTASHIV